MTKSKTKQGMKIGDKIKIIKCDAFGKQFENLIADSEHLVIKPPKGYKNDNKGCWVMGVGEPVKVLNNEFILLDN